MHYLNRESTGISPEIWQEIDAAAVDAAKDVLTGRRFLDLQGPHGIGLTAIELGADDFCREPGPDEAGAIMSRAISVPMLRKSCQLSIRRLEAHRHMGQPLDLSAVEDAAEAVARREEEFIILRSARHRSGGIVERQRPPRSQIFGLDQGRTGFERCAGRRRYLGQGRLPRTLRSGSVAGSL